MKKVSQTTVALVVGIASGLFFGGFGYSVGLVLQDAGSVTPGGYISPWSFAIIGFLGGTIFMSLLILSIPEQFDVIKLVSRLFKKKKSKS